MKNSQYLYGDAFNAKTMSEMPYTTALTYKNRCAYELTKMLVSESTMSTDWRRINTIAKAIKFNEALLLEAQGRD